MLESQILRRERQTPLQRAYYTGFLIALFGCFSPFKLLAYTLPSVVTGLLLVRGADRTIRQRLSVMLMVLCVLALFYAAVSPEFIAPNFFLACITYSAFLPILLVDSRSLVSRRLYERTLIAAARMLAFQAAFGIAQAVYNGVQAGHLNAANGDAVEGTIAPAMASDNSGSNPMFAVNIALMLLACMSLPTVFAGKRTRWAILGIIALVLASVMHVLIFGMCAVAAAWFVTRPPRSRTARHRRSWRGLIAFVFFVGLTATIMDDELMQVEDVVLSVFDVDALVVPRTVLLYRLYDDMPHDAPMQPWVGLGPGQFSSRASMIASGMYLGGPDAPKAVPFFSGQTALAREYLTPLLFMMADAPEFSIGSTQQPFFSALSVYTELGVGALCVLVWWLIRLTLRVRARVLARPDLRFRGALFGAGAFLVALLGLQDQYWEIPQAIFIGLLLLKLVYANLMFDEDEAPA